MSVKTVDIPRVGMVSLYKRKGSKTMRLSISHDGKIKLSMPRWAPYSSGIQFVISNYKWISEHKNSDKILLEQGLRIGKAHVLNFVNTDENKISSRIKLNEILVKVPNDIYFSSKEVQRTAHSASIRCLKKESEQLIPKRLEFFANKYNFAYSDVKIKQLKSRWGSCNNLQQITFSLYLIQLPWELIDYVILHELTHTKVLAHGPIFWNELKKYIPDAKELKKQVNQYKPIIHVIS